MPIGELAMYYVLCKLYTVKVKKDCLWKKEHKKSKKIGDSVRPSKNFGTGFWYRIFLVGPDKYKQICHINWEPDKLQTKYLFPV